MTAPKLRFKEFDANWSLSSLGKMTTYFKGYAFKSESYKDSGIRVIRVSDLGRESIKTDNDSIYIDANNASAYENWIIKKDDIIITTVGSKPHLVDSAVGRPIYVKNNNEGLLNQNLLVLRPIDETVDSYFIYAQLLDKKYLTHIELIQRGNANQSNITVKDLQDFETYITSKKEQTKIASFLSAVDEKISQLTQKHQLLSQYKQGMMQKLFSHQLRFKADDGSEFDEWEYKPLHEIANKNSIKNKDGSVTEVLTNSALQGIIKQSDYFDREIVTESNLSGYYLVNINDFVYNPRISVHAPVGPIKRNKKCLGVMSPLYTIFTVEIGNLIYLEYFFDSNFWHDYVKSVANSGARHDRMNITNKDFFEMPILYPCLEEQTKIANFLSAIDQKIEVTAQQIEQAKQWKKGLLQQMFV